MHMQWKCNLHFPCYICVAVNPHFSILRCQLHILSAFFCNAALETLLYHNLFTSACLYCLCWIIEKLFFFAIFSWLCRIIKIHVQGHVR